jgi:hypothetical protein
MWWRLLDVTSIGRGLDPFAGHWTRGVQIETVPSYSSSSQSCHCSSSYVTDMSLALVNCNLASISVCSPQLSVYIRHTNPVHANLSILVFSLGLATSPDPNYSDRYRITVHEIYTSFWLSSRVPE